MLVKTWGNIILSLQYEIITLTLIALIINAILSVFFKNKEKKDDGFEFSYFKLSYRRKMIRTLWMLPLVAISLMAIYWFADLNFYKNLVISIFSFIILLIQFSYNYHKWNKYER